MQERKFSVMIAQFTYGSNGGSQVTHPDVSDWVTETVLKMKQDNRVGEIKHWRRADTPITMTRNAAARTAIQAGVDFLVMVDSDMAPDYELHLGTPGARPWWDTAFNFAVQHYDKGPCIVGAPYCGPPPNENVYIFKVASLQSCTPNPSYRVAQIDREDAARRTGIETVMALPTGLILFDVRTFSVVPPPWFYYEYTDEYESEKASTEDVTATRDALFFFHREGLPLPLYCTWDCWAGHWKPKCVGKPQEITCDMLGEKYTRAAQHGRDGRFGHLEVGHDAMKCMASSPETPCKPGNFYSAGMETADADISQLQRLVREVEHSAQGQPIHVVEVGSFAGRTAIAIDDAMTHPESHLYCVDTWNGSPTDASGRLAQFHGDGGLFRIFQKNTAGRKRLSAYKMESLCAAIAIDKLGVKMDMVFIDADHSYEAVRADITAWMPLIKPGGIICGHDYGEFEGVTRAVKELVPGHQSNIHVWWYRLPDDVPPVPSQPHQNSSLLAAMLDVLREDRRLQVDSRPIRVACWPHGTLKASLNGDDAADIVDAANPWDADLLVNAAPHDSDTFLAEATRFARHGTIIVGQGSHPVGPNTQGEERDGFWAQRILRAPNGANPMECVGLVQVR